MSDNLSRRDLLIQSLPAAAIGATLFTTASAFAQNAPPAGAPATTSNLLDMLVSLDNKGTYALPKLPYAYDALEPHIDAQTMELHHSKHHAAYVNNLNKAIDSLAKLRNEKDIDPAKLSALSRDISFNAGGAILHTLFFGIMGKPAEIPPQLEVLHAINDQYGNLDQFKLHFTKVANGLKGSGWAIAAYEPMAGKILITESGDQDLRMIPGSVPLLLVDVWEHAYYLKYQNKRADYVSAWWNVVNWGEVNALFLRCQQMFRR